MAGNYEKYVKQLDKKLAEGKISQEDYNVGTGVAYVGGDAAAINAQIKKQREIRAEKEAVEKATSKTVVRAQAITSSTSYGIAQETVMIDSSNYAVWDANMVSTYNEVHNAVSQFEDELRHNNSLDNDSKILVEKAYAKAKATEENIKKIREQVEAVFKLAKETDNTVIGIIMSIDVDKLKISKYTYVSGGVNEYGTGSNAVRFGEDNIVLGLNTNGIASKRGSDTVYTSDIIYRDSDGQMSFGDVTFVSALGSNFDYEGFVKNSGLTNKGYNNCHDDAINVAKNMLLYNKWVENNDGLDFNSYSNCFNATTETFKYSNSNDVIAALKQLCDSGKISMLHLRYVNSNGEEGQHWVTVTGYKNNGTSLEDFMGTDNWSDNGSGGAVNYTLNSNFINGLDGASFVKGNNYGVHSDCIIKVVSV